MTIVVRSQETSSCWTFQANELVRAKAAAVVKIKRSADLVELNFCMQNGKKKKKKTER